MLTRRLILSAAPAILAVPAVAASGGFDVFLANLRGEARKAGISQRTIDAALSGLAPNQKVIERDRRQAEFSMTWIRYRDLVITDQRIQEGRRAVAQNRALLQQVESRYGVSSRVIAGIWGIESSFGQHMGDYHVIESLATLAWEGRRAKFFHGELMAALKIIDQGNVTPRGMMGSWAGAMGQPQFMPSSFLSYAVDFDGDGKRDIWTSRADVFGSIANYLARSGWRGGETWGQRVALPANFEPWSAGRDNKHPLSEWMRMGVRPLEGIWDSPSDRMSAIVIPDGGDGAAFVVHHNFGAIRRYNPSDFYALAVGLIGDQIAG